MKLKTIYELLDHRDSFLTLQRRIPLTLKVGLLILAVSVAAWTIMDHIQTDNLGSIIQETLPLDGSQNILQEDIITLRNSLVTETRLERSITASVFIILSLLIIYTISRRLKNINNHITSFSQDTLGIKRQEATSGDQLHLLKERFTSLTEEVNESRKTIQMQAEEHMRLIMDNTFDAIITTSSEGSITSWNPMAETYFGYSAEEMIGRKCYEHLPCKPEWFASENSSVDPKAPLLKTELTTGTGYCLEISCLPVHNERDSLLYTIIIAVNLTELKSTQQTLMAYKNELNKKTIELDKFYEIAVNRELKMKTMKKEISDLRKSANPWDCTVEKSDTSIPTFWI